MKELMQQYGGIILGIVGAGALIGVFLAVLAGPFAELLTRWGAMFL